MHNFMWLLLLMVQHAQFQPSHVSRSCNKDSVWLKRISTEPHFSCASDCLKKTCKKRCSGTGGLPSNITDTCNVQLSIGCYIFYVGSKAINSRSDAVKECSKVGMVLSSLETMEEAKVVTKHLAKIQGGSEEFAYWLSATSLLKRKIQRWNTNGPEVLKALWHKTEPNDGLITNEQCVFILRHHAQYSNYRIALADVPCDYTILKTGVICEQI